MPDEFDRMSRDEFDAFIVHIGMEARITAALASEGATDPTRTDARVPGSEGGADRRGAPVR